MATQLPLSSPPGRQARRNNRPGRQATRQAQTVGCLIQPLTGRLRAPATPANLPPRRPRARAVSLAAFLSPPPSHSLLPLSRRRPMACPGKRPSFSALPSRPPDPHPRKLCLSIRSKPSLPSKNCSHSPAPRPPPQAISSTSDTTTRTTSVYARGRGCGGHLSASSQTAENSTNARSRNGATPPSAARRTGGGHFL